MTLSLQLLFYANLPSYFAVLSYWSSHPEMGHGPILILLARF